MVELAQAVTETTVSWEGIFHLEEIKALRFDPSWPPEEVYRFTTLEVRRRPEEPIFHTYRLLLALHQEWDHHLYGILVDVVYGLGKHGRGLQKLLFELVAARLPLSQQNLFEMFFSGSLQELPWGEFSVLHPGTVGRHGESAALALDPPCREHDSGEPDPLVVARLSLEAGQLEETIEILKEALQKHPEREDIRRELEELQRHLSSDDR